MARQVAFTKHEAALLLDAYLKVVSGELSRMDSVKECSRMLRAMAVNSGVEIEDIYRNVNGISFQMASMESAYQGRTIMKPATRLFTEMVTLFMTNKEEYRKLLKEAKDMADTTQNNEATFMSWLSENVSATQLSELSMALVEIEQQAKKVKLVKHSLYEVLEPSAVKKIRANIEQSRVFRFTHKRQWGRITSAMNYLVQFSTQNEAGANREDASTATATELKEAEHKNVLDVEPVQTVSEVTQQEDKCWSEKDKPEEAVSSNDGYATIDFEHLDSMVFSKPLSLSYFGEVRPESSWKGLYVDACKSLLDDYPEIFARLKQESMTGTGKTWLVEKQQLHLLAVPKKIEDGYFVETNRSASDLVKNLKWLLDECSVDYENFVITYVSMEKRNTSSLIIPASSERKYYQEDKDSFYRWLKDNQHMAEGTCRSYVSAIRSAERFAKEHSLEHVRLYTDDPNETKATAEELFAHEGFCKYNEEQHNRFRAAINKLLESIGERVPRSLYSTAKKKQLPDVQSDSDIIKVLQAHYQYGFKYSSIRELMRFRQFADGMDISLPDDDDRLKELIIASGTVIDNKVYCKSEDLPKELQAIVDEITSTGVEVVYYESLFLKRSEWMTTHIITSEEMLKELLKTYVSGFSFSKKFMTQGRKRTEKDAVSDEIRRIWGEQPIRGVSFLDEHLPYIPAGNIWRVISGNDSFVLVSEGEYLLIDRFQITEDEEEDILDFVEDECTDHGFASLTDVPLGDIEEVNFELSQHAIYNAVYKTVLSRRYHLNGKILTKDNPALDAVSLLKGYITGREQCSFDEVANRVIELTGGSNRQYAFQALYDEMVRIDKDHYVANRLVNFDVEEVDRALSVFITDHFCAIRDVTTFAMFPVCGQNWNHYLLESFCYKYSLKYRLHVIHLNNKNAGIIAEREFGKTYDEMLALALARSDISLTSDIAGPYLFNTGYLAKSKYAKLEDILNQAALLR